MSDSSPIPLARAQHWAAKIVTWLQPHCERIEIAGSIRRQRPFVNDIDLVCIPKIEEHKDLVGAIVERTNFLWDFLKTYVQDRNPGNFQSRTPRFKHGGEKEGKSVSLQGDNCQLDIWFATEQTWATLLICRTGSKEHNIWLASRAIDRGYHWNPYEGLVRAGFSGHENTSIPRLVTPTEESIYAALGLKLIGPTNREIGWLRQNIDSGLES